MEKLFIGKEKFATKGIIQTLPRMHQIFLWNCIEERLFRDEKMDYLQVFKLQSICDPDVPDKRVTKIIYSQKIPEYENTYFLRDGSSPVEGTIFVIDDGTVITMLWADEH